VKPAEAGDEERLNAAGGGRVFERLVEGLAFRGGNRQGGLVLHPAVILMSDGDSDGPARQGVAIGTPFAARGFHEVGLCLWCLRNRWKTD